MKKLGTLILVVFAVLLAGCGTMVNVSDGEGYKPLTPSPETRNFVLKNDVEFARQIAAHNKQCNEDIGCSP